jgi:predicted nucleic acid-binding protein
VIAAIDLHNRYKLSFWDGLILVAAKAADASLVWSEDLGHGQVYDGVRVENPFLTH